VTKKKGGGGGVIATCANGFFFLENPKNSPKWSCFQGKKKVEIARFRP
jgi:hypothetical protein